MESSKINRSKKQKQKKMAEIISIKISRSFKKTSLPNFGTVVKQTSRGKVLPIWDRFPVGWFFSIRNRPVVVMFAWVIYTR